MLQKIEAYGFPATPLVLEIESEDKSFQIKGVDGLDPVKAVVSTTPLIDKEILTGTSLGKRNIVITAGLNPDWALGETYEGLRKVLYQYFMPRQEVRLRLTSTHMPTVDIYGVVEDCASNIFTADPEYQISIICADPAFKGITPKTLTGKTTKSPNLTRVPLDYEGSLPGGFLLTVKANTAVPSYNSFVAMSTGDGRAAMSFTGRTDSARRLELSAVPSQRFVRERTPSTALVRSLLSTVPNSTIWPLLMPSGNDILVLTNTAGLDWSIEYTEQFGGI